MTSQLEAPDSLIVPVTAQLRAATAYGRELLSNGLQILTDTQASRYIFGQRLPRRRFSASLLFAGNKGMYNPLARWFTDWLSVKIFPA